jgi:hypothetical protein
MVVSMVSPVYSTSARSQPGLAKCPPFDHSLFTHPTQITNPLLPMPPGTLYVFTGASGGKPTNDILTITHDTKMIAGVKTLVVNDTGTVKGVKTESTLDYFAQDDKGNVWYFGEYALQFKEGKIIGHAGSWLAGVHGALPGYVMEANPKVGDFYCQENAPGAAQDQAQVLSLKATICVPYVCVHSKALLTNETSPLEPGTVEHKWYVAGDGNVLAMDVAGGADTSSLVAILKS